MLKDEKIVPPESVIIKPGPDQQKYGLEEE